VPRCKIETSLFDPLIIELGEKVYTSVHRSVRLIKAFDELQAKRKSGAVSDLDATIQILGLIFGVDAEEFQTIDQTYLQAIAEKAMEYMGEGGKAKPGSETTKAEPEKNALTPGSEPTP